MILHFLIQNRAEVISMSIFEYDKKKKSKQLCRRLLFFHSLYIFTQSTIVSYSHDVQTPA
ncbi:MAG: hypothetical protein EGQ79_04235 [Ruminococcus sp.]|nr:hypothetical protein [Ruminococcus sp.]MBD8931331.1 hypothetical protein [Ruminococcus sp.]